MAKHTYPRRLRVRRTINAPAPPLSRALWGIAAADARTLLEAQHRQFHLETTALDDQLHAEQARLAELTDEVERLKRRLDALRKVVEVLRSKLAHERAARAVLATRLLDRQAEEEKAMQADAKARMEAVRLGADIQQEHEALRQLVAALYRSISGRNGVPTGLEVLTQVPSPPARSGMTRPTAPWHRFLLGKKAGRALHAKDGRVILHEMETIGPDELTASEQEGLLFELILSAKVVERLPDL